MISLFGGGNEFVEIGVRALRANNIIFFSFGFQFTYSTLYLVLGKATSGMVLNLSRQGIFFITFILVLPAFIGLNGVIYAQAIADACTVVLTLIMAVRVNSELRQMEQQPPIIAVNQNRKSTTS